MTPASHSTANSGETARSLPLRALGRAEDMVMALLVIAIFGVVLAGILSRFVFHVSLSWTTEVSVTLMIWMTFLGIAIAVRDRVQVAFELFEGKLTGRWHVAVALIQMLLMGFLLVSLAWGGWLFTQLGMEQQTPSGIPQWVSFAAVPVGSVLSLLHLTVCAWDVMTDEPLGTEVTQGQGPSQAGAQ